MVNGGGLVAGFDIDLPDNAPHNPWIGPHRNEYPLADMLVRSACFADALPEVASRGVSDDTGFQWLSSLQLDGSLGAALWRGGAYETFRGTPAAAKAMGAAVCTSLFGDRYEDIRVDYSRAAWSGWFYDVACDNTWVITDRRDRHMTVLCVTDTD